MNGFNVLHPMGWDSFGLPAEQYAIKTGQHPSVTTFQNIDNFRRQLKMLGFSYDWDREIATTDHEYVRWTQWIFLQLYNSYYNRELKKARPVSELEEPGAEPRGNRPAPPGLRGGSGRQLVPGPGHRPGQRGSGGMEIQGPPGGTPPPAPVDAAHHGTTRSASLTNWSRWTGRNPSNCSSATG